MTKIAVSFHSGPFDNVFDQAAESQVVAGHASLGRMVPTAVPRCVVLAEAHDNKARHLAVLDERIVLVDERDGIVRIADAFAFFFGMP